MFRITFAAWLIFVLGLQASAQDIDKLRFDEQLIYTAHLALQAELDCQFKIDQAALDKLLSKSDLDMFDVAHAPRSNNLKRALDYLKSSFKDSRTCEKALREMGPDSRFKILSPR